MIRSVYCDGGVIGKNPSSIGGTWAWIQVDENDCEIRKESGVIHTDNDFPTISNNVTEMVAAVQALVSLPDGWSGDFYSDSLITIGRLWRGYAWNGIDDNLKFAGQNILKVLGTITPHLLSGHPTKAQLISGVGPRGYPCSKWNVECDKECRRLAKEYMEKINVSKS